MVLNGFWSFCKYYPKINILTFGNEDAIFPFMNPTPSEGQEWQTKLEQARKELTLLYDISNALRSTLELDHILYTILTCVTSHVGLGFNRAVLFLVNKNKRVLEGKMGIGPESGEEADKIWKYIEHSNKQLDDLIAVYKESKEIFDCALNKQISKIEIPLNPEDGGLLAKVYNDGRPLHIPSEGINKYSQDPLFSVFKTNELVIMPTKAKNKVNGIIVADNLYTQKPISEDDMKIFEMLANHAGLAIENSQLYEMVVHKSRTDSLTGLWNHGFFQDALAEEIGQAQKTKHPLSLIMIDIDDFKKLNDSYGHQKGDLVLTQIAKILKENSREADKLCRYGGEEFAVILPNTPTEQAFAIAERLRQQVADSLFTMANTKAVHLTVSIGLATYPIHATTKEELIMKADKAMYTAKFTGKNTTQIAG